MSADSRIEFNLYIFHGKPFFQKLCSVTGRYYICLEYKWLITAYLGATKIK